MDSALIVTLPSLQLDLFHYRGKISADTSEDGNITKDFAAFLNLSSTFFPQHFCGSLHSQEAGFWKHSFLQYYMKFNNSPPRYTDFCAT